MAVMITRDRDAKVREAGTEGVPAARPGRGAGELAALTGATVLGTLTIAGRPERVREARDFITAALGELALAGPEGSALADTATLLTSELVTNAVRHSDSGKDGGSVRVLLLETTAGIRVEVTDDGSGASSPVVRGDLYASDGHGLFLVEAMAREWGYLRGTSGTTVWFALRR